jgi:hypothetical protein
MTKKKCLIIVPRLAENRLISTNRDGRRLRENHDADENVDKEEMKPMTADVEIGRQQPGVKVIKRFFGHTRRGQIS